MNQDSISLEIYDLISDYYSNELIAVYGFGSYFRSSSYRDIDLIAVSNEEVKNELNIYKALLYDLKILGDKHSTQFDLTYLKSSEFENAPILEKGSLIEVYTNKI